MWLPLSLGALATFVLLFADRAAASASATREGLGAGVCLTGAVVLAGLYQFNDTLSHAVTMGDFNQDPAKGLVRLRC